MSVLNLMRVVCGVCACAGLWCVTACTSMPWYSSGGHSEVSKCHVLTFQPVGGKASLLSTAAYGRPAGHQAPEDSPVSAVSLACFELWVTDMCAPQPRFDMGAGGVNSGLYPCIAGTLLTELSNSDLK